ncbi:MAG: hypothetical protein OXK73_07150 [Rhodospirillaceae bacterium]|nr:hypothetical protein [Rhodospirillaceae bacterium]
MTSESGGLRLPRTRPVAALTCVIAFGALLALGGCGAGPLWPMDEPTRAVGDTEVWHTRTGTTTHTLVALDATSMHYEVAESGCTYTMPRDGLSPWTSWANCWRLPDGTQTVTLTAGQIWPLEIGRTWRYRRAGSDASGEQWDEEVRCRVTKQDRIEKRIGFYRVFYTVCMSEKERHVLYVSPDLGRSIRTWYSRLDRLVPPIKRELVHFTPGN